MKKILILLAGIGCILFLVPGMAKANQPGHVYAYVDYNKSWSNMLFSFKTDGGYVSQAYIPRGGCGGEKPAYIPPTQTLCYQGGEPLNMWVNPHTCAGWTYAYYNTYTGALTGTNPWNYISGGAYGVSVNVNGGSGLPDSVTEEIRAYLVPNGAYGCVA